MRMLMELILAPPTIGDRALVLHMVVKTLVVSSVLVVLWVTRAQASVVYEAF